MNGIPVKKETLRKQLRTQELHKRFKTRVRLVRKKNQVERKVTEVSNCHNNLQDGYITYSTEKKSEVIVKGVRGRSEEITKKLWKDRGRTGWVRISVTTYKNQRQCHRVKIYSARQSR